MKAAKAGTRTLVAGIATLGAAQPVWRWLTAALDLLVARLFGSGGCDGGSQSDLIGVAGEV